MISSFLLQDTPRHPDTRLFEVREAFKRSLLLRFQAHIRPYTSQFFRLRAALRGPSGGPCGGLARLRHATRAEPLINALVRNAIV